MNSLSKMMSFCALLLGTGPALMAMQQVAVPIAAKSERPVVSNAQRCNASGKLDSAIIAGDIPAIIAAYNSGADIHDLVCGEFPGMTAPAILRAYTHTPAEKKLDVIKLLIKWGAKLETIKESWGKNDLTEYERIVKLLQ